MTRTIGESLREHADKTGHPRRTLEQVKAGLASRVKQKCDPYLMARLMLTHGRLTDEARAYLKEFVAKGA